jgi:hypothetical protein
VEDEEEDGMFEDADEGQEPMDQWRHGLFAAEKFIKELRVPILPSWVTTPAL